MRTIKEGEIIHRCNSCGSFDIEQDPYASRPDAQADERGTLSKDQACLEAACVLEWAALKIEGLQCRLNAAAPSPEREQVGEAILPAKSHCQNGGDVCLAGNRDGVCCPEDSCDIDDGVRKVPASSDDLDRLLIALGLEPRAYRRSDGHLLVGAILSALAKKHVADAPPSRECGEPPAENAAVRNKIAAALHYPDHWDTAAYPTLDDAAWEAIAAANLTCSECGERQGAALSEASVRQIAHRFGVLYDDRVTFYGDTLTDFIRAILAASAPTLGESTEPALEAPKGCYPEKWGPSNNRRLTCACGNPNPSHWEPTAPAGATTLGDGPNGVTWELWGNLIEALERAAKEGRDD